MCYRLFVISDHALPLVPAAGPAWLFAIHTADAAVQRQLPVPAGWCVVEARSTSGCACDFHDADPAGRRWLAGYLDTLAGRQEVRLVSTWYGDEALPYDVRPALPVDGLLIADDPIPQQTVIGIVAAMPPHDLIAAARNLATRAHAGQQRDDSGDPYIVHPTRVAARLARRFPDDPALAAAGWCHDVLEDCPHIAPDELRAAIGDDALAIVREVTNPSKAHAHLPRAERKAMDRAHIATISRRARCLKLADRADNLRDGCASPDKDWLATYVRESRLLAEALRGTDPELERDLQDALTAAAQAAGID